MAKVVVVRPKFDPATTVLFEWTRNFMLDYKNKGYNDEIKDFAEGAANTQNVVAYLGSLTDRSDTLFIHFDHGVFDKLFGQDKSVIVDKRSAAILKDLVVYAFACESARTLGKAAVEAGARCYIGYKDIFGFVIPKSNDFKYVAVEPANVLVSGGTAEAAYNSARDLLLKLLDKFYQEYKETGSYESYMAAVWAYKDLKGLTLLGDPNASITRGVKAKNTQTITKVAAYGYNSLLSDLSIYTLGYRLGVYKGGVIQYGLFNESGYSVDGVISICKNVFIRYVNNMLELVDYHLGWHVDNKDYVKTEDNIDINNLDEINNFLKANNLFTDLVYYKEYLLNAKFGDSPKKLAPLDLKMPVGAKALSDSFTLTVVDDAPIATILRHVEYNYKDLFKNYM
jgi:hypothetical protein